VHHTLDKRKAGDYQTLLEHSLKSLRVDILKYFLNETRYSCIGIAVVQRGGLGCKLVHTLLAVKSNKSRRTWTESSGRITSTSVLTSARERTARTVQVRWTRLIAGCPGPSLTAVAVAVQRIAGCVVSTTARLTTVDAVLARLASYTTHRCYQSFFMSSRTANNQSKVFFLDSQVQLLIPVVMII